MHTILKRTTCLFLLLSVLLGGCRKEFEEFYKRPDNLAAPIYQQLQTDGNFSILLQLIDKAGYKQTLSSAGSWTFFAANDDAFKQYFQEKGISVNDISNAEAEAIVRYSMIYDGEKSDRLSDYFSSKGFVENQAFRRRTLYYDFVYQGKNDLGQDINIIAYNRNSPAAYNTADFNNKNIPVFLPGFMQLKGLDESDYTTLFPNSTYTGFNVGPASVSASNRDIVAENGIIHQIDKVLVPPPSIDQYINSNPEYSSFRDLLENFTGFAINSDISHKYQVLTGKSEDVYVKLYNTLAFSPNNENYLKLDANDAQTDCYSIIAPNNAAVQRFAKEVLLKYFPRGTTLEQLAATRQDIIQAFVSSHMLTTALWPSKFSRLPNNQGENFKLNLSTDITDKRFLSNGIFYGSTKVHEANVFTTVYSKVFLDPKFSIMKAALDRYGFSARLQEPTAKYMLIPIADAILKKAGFTYDPAAFPNAPVRLNGNADDVVLKRIVGIHVIDLKNRGTVPNVQVGEGFLLSATNEPDNYEYVRYKDGKLYSSGTIDSSYTALDGLTKGAGLDYIRIDSISSGINGPVIYTAGMLRHTENNVGISIERNGTTSTQPYYNFFQYLKNSTLYNATTKTITGVDLGLSYTLFIPTNAQILQAVRDGVLPGTFTATTVTPTFNPSAEDQKAMVERFIRYHIIDKMTIAADGHPLRTGLRGTILKDLFGDGVTINITENTTSSLKVRDSFGRTATVINPQSSLLSNRTVIHQIDTYLKYAL